MTIVNLYRYQRADGGYTVSPVKPEDGIEYVQRYRLIADDDKAITNGTIITSCAVRRNQLKRLKRASFRFYRTPYNLNYPVPNEGITGR